MGCVCSCASCTVDTFIWHIQCTGHWARGRGNRAGSRYTQSSRMRVEMNTFQTTQRCLEEGADALTGGVIVGPSAGVKTSRQGSEGWQGSTDA